MNQVQAIMITLTTYSMWLRGDARGWVDKGTVFPTDLVLEAADRARLKHPPMQFAPEQWLPVGQYMGEAMISRCGLTLFALTVQSWHVHVVTSATPLPVSHVVKCAKDAVRWGLRAGRPIWATGYDKRFCYDLASARNRIEYVERHNLAVGRPAKPWAFIQPVVL
jgi:hypothetical protein